MGWEEKKSIKRILNTFKRLKTKIFDEDVEALKQLNEAIDLKAKTDVNEYLLYAKLLCVLMRLNLEYYKDIKLSIKDVNNALKMPLGMHLEFLEKSLNSIELIKYFKSIGIDFDSYKNQEEILTEHQQEITKKLKEAWSYENVEKSFYNSADTFLKDVENYK